LAPSLTTNGLSLCSFFSLHFSQRKKSWK